MSRVDLADHMLAQRGRHCAVPAPAAEIAYDYANRMVSYCGPGVSGCGTGVSPVDCGTGILPMNGSSGTSSSGADGLCHTYAYDALGRRIRRTVNANAAPQTRFYFYDGWRVIEERDECASTGDDPPQATYVYPDISGLGGGVHGIDEVLTVRRRVAPGTPGHPGGGGLATVDYWYHADDLGSIVAVTDSAGEILERYEYNDYGQPQIFDNSGNPRTASAIGNAVMFTGRWFDPETGLYEYRHRYFDPRSGRFTTRDPIGTWEDETNLGNAYSYVGNDPWTLIDPDGLEATGDEIDAMTRGGRLARGRRPTGLGTPEGKRLTDEQAHQTLKDFGRGAYQAGDKLMTAADAYSLGAALAARVAARAALRKLGKEIAEEGAENPGKVKKLCGWVKSLFKKKPGTAKHHAWPEYLGGPVKQDLEKLPKHVHDAYHSGLDKLLPRKLGTDYYKALPAERQAENFRLFQEYTEAFDKEFGTHLWDAVKKVASAE